MEDDEVACKAVEKLPDLEDVADDADPAGFMTPEEMVRSSPPLPPRPLNNLSPALARERPVLAAFVAHSELSQ